jgi:hypothetical protein
VLTAGTLIAVTYALLYDLAIAAIAGAMADSRQPRFRLSALGETLLATAYLMPLFAFQAGLVSHLPFAPLASVILVVLCGLRAWQEHKGRRGRYPDNAVVGRQVTVRPADAMAGTSSHSHVSPVGGSKAAG